MQDIRLALITGVDIAMPECQLVLHQPKLKEIALIGEKEFFTGLQCLNLNKNMVESYLQNASNFQIFMGVLADNRASEYKEAVMKVLSLILPNTKIVFLPNSLILNKDGVNVTIDENTFDLFQSVIIEMFCLKGKGNTGFNPGGKKAKEIADKLMRARQKVAEEHGEGDSSILVTYMSCISVALSTSLLDISNYTLYQLYDIMERYGLYLAWDIDIRVRVAGGKPDEKQDNWMKNIH